MTWPLDIRQHLSLITLGTTVFVQWVMNELTLMAVPEAIIGPTAGALSHQELYLCPQEVECKRPSE